MTVANTNDFTWVGIFDDRVEAQKAVDDLEQAGFDHNDIRYAIRGSDAVAGGTITDAQGAKDKRGGLYGVLFGAMIGAAVGIAGGMIFHSGMDRMAGALAMMVGGMFVGAAVGGISGAMFGLRVSENEATKNEGQFGAGKAIVSVHNSPRAEEAQKILRSHGGYDIHQENIEPIASTMKP